MYAWKRSEQFQGFNLWALQYFLIHPIDIYKHLLDSMILYLDRRAGSTPSCSGLLQRGWYGAEPSPEPAAGAEQPAGGPKPLPDDAGPVPGPEAAPAVPAAGPGQTQPVPAEAAGPGQSAQPDPAEPVLLLLQVQQWVDGEPGQRR